ncbi:MAG: DNA primase [Deltaproteobacteria bacterium]|nr:DNA primase [Deltaproteobacteria bacterium]
MHLSEQKIAEIREATDFLATVQQYVELKSIGGNNFIGLCPFHVEKTPSFTVNPDKGYFHCFGCHAGGDVIKFLMLATGMNFSDTVAELARRSGIDISEKDFSNDQAEDRERQHKKLMYAAMERAKEIFVSNLWTSSGLGVRNYLRERGVDDLTSRHFGLGYSLANWNSLSKTLMGEGFSEEILSDAGLIKPREPREDRRGLERKTSSFYDTFRDRLMIPIQDADSRVVAFAGRYLGSDGDKSGQAKYINSPTTDIYKKGSLLYGFPQARPHLKAAGCVFIVEGYFDLVSMVAKGIPNTVASMGTALTQGQVNMLRGHVKLVYLFFDGDTAGREAAKKALPKLLNAEIEGKVLILPEKEDPDTFLRGAGDEAVYQLAEKQSINVLDYAVDRLLSSHPDTIYGQTQVLRAARELLSEVRDSAKGQILQRMLATRLGIDPKHLELSAEPMPEAIKSPSNVYDSQPKSIFDKLLFHILAHPETGEILEELLPFWPENESTPLFELLLAQHRAVGLLEPAKIPYLLMEKLPFISRAAVEGRQFEPQVATLVALTFASEIKTQRFLEALKKLSLEIRKAEVAGDSTRSMALLEKRRAVHEEIRDLEEFKMSLLQQL